MSEQGSKGEDVFDLDRIRRLVDLMKEHGLSEVDLQQADNRIRLARNQQISGLVPAPMASIPTIPQGIVPQGVGAAPTPVESDDRHIVTIKSPMVGTFYCRPNPNSKNFVDVGSSVEPDSIVCIIEAMKVFNEIPSEVRGKIVAVLVQNEEAVDFGKPLFKVDTRG